MLISNSILAVSIMLFTGVGAAGFAVRLIQLATRKKANVN